MRPYDDVPIAAIATAPGRGGIGVVRVSGRGIAALAAPLLGAARAAALVPRHASYGPFLAGDGGEIDRGVALFFPAPRSYTGEDVLELQGHGGPVVMQLVLRRVLEAGAALGVRLAAPGEFTQRAFLNDKLDLAQAEAVADLIDASTEQAARGAARSLAGEFSDAIRALVERVIHLRMLVEATLDFPEEEIDFLERADARGQIDAIVDALVQVMARARQGALLREGLNVVLVGRPNVGKSSLLNALAGAEVAIVTPIAGTTRDKVTQAIQIEGVPVNVIDTAGLREATDEVERIGVARTWDEVGKADVIVHLVVAGAGALGGDAGAARHGAARDGAAKGGAAGKDEAMDADIARRLPAGVPVVRVHNKIDLAGVPARADGRTDVWLSAKSGAGIAELRRVLLALAGWQGAGEAQFIARERHLDALRHAAAHLAQAQAYARARAASLELFAEELRLAQERLNEITGEFTADDLLGVIFGRFCIGK